MWHSTPVYHITWVPPPPISGSSLTRNGVWPHWTLFPGHADPGVYDRVNQIQALDQGSEMTFFFFFFFCLSAAQRTPVFMTGSRFEVIREFLLGQGIICKFFVRYIMTGCILCAPSALRQGQVFKPQRHPPPRPLESRVPPPPPPSCRNRILCSTSLISVESAHH